MIPVSYVAPGEKSSPRFCAAFARGCGGRTVLGPALAPGPVALFGSPQLWAMLQRAIADGREWWYGDHGYFGRSRYFRIARNAYQHDGLTPATPDRFRSFGRTVAPWRKGGRHVVVCPNSDVYFGFFGLTAAGWIADVTNRLRAHTDRQIVVRWKRDARPIADDLRRAWAVVAFSSAAALDALIAGVPAFTLADFAATYRMGTPDLSRIEDPLYPDDREPFLWSLADRQWTLAEIERGAAWRALREEAACATRS